MEGENGFKTGPVVASGSRALSLWSDKTSKGILNSVGRRLSYPLSAVTYISKVVVKLLALLVMISVAAVICYIIFHDIYLPKFSVTKPVLFFHKTATKVRDNVNGKDTIIIKTTAAELSLSDVEFQMSPGQSYRITLYLDMPDSEINAHSGAFGLRTTIFDSKNRVTTQQHRILQLKYKSRLIRYIESFLYLPFYIIGLAEERHQTAYDLFTRYVEKGRGRESSMLELEIDNPEIQIYDAWITIQAQFTGLRYFMYYWPIISAIFISSIIFTILTVIIAIYSVLSQFGIWRLLLLILGYESNPLYKKPPVQARHLNGTTDLSRSD